MTKPRFKSKGWKKVKKKIPSGVTIHYRRKKPNKAKCGRCGKELHGVPRLRPIQLNKLPKTKKRPERPYGGNLCSSCMRELMREKARSV